ncbi:YdeI/OmpD-associated family protein [Pararhodonellum marinum]|uniref:YdeI/OmpD-associated family protein n=1 Tax=Pararhodonellum marinum TaxID=2755358 RepID=UPI00188F9356|nr:YdeI/OmpD-associated family protein [Pararhodonellum marinum]
MTKHEHFREALDHLKSLLKETEMEPSIKWGMDVYTVNGQNVVGAIAFKNHVSLWFYNGVFLSDPKKVLSNAQDGKTKAMRHWQFTSLEEIKAFQKDIKAYLHEAISNEKSGKRWQPEKDQSWEIPELLKNALELDPDLKANFEELSPYKQKEYALHIQEAKQEKTKVARLEKIRPMIMQGMGLNDRYK